MHAAPEIPPVQPAEAKFCRRKITGTVWPPPLTLIEVVTALSIRHFAATELPHAELTRYTPEGNVTEDGQAADAELKAEMIAAVESGPQAVTLELAPPGVVAVALQLIVNAVEL